MESGRRVTATDAGQRCELHTATTPLRLTLDQLPADDPFALSCRSRWQLMAMSRY